MHQCTICIPTLNAASYIGKVLFSLERQTTSCEVIVVDSSSTDSTVKIAESLGAKTITIKMEDFDHGGTRNLAARYAQGDVVVFLTQDALPDDEYCLENLIRPLENPEIAATYGRQIPTVNATPVEKFARLFNYPPTPIVKGKDDISKLGIKTFFFSNACSAIRKKEFEELGGFSEKVIMNEDTILAAKLILKGYKIAYMPEAKVIHCHNYTWGQQFKRYFDIGVSHRDNMWMLEYGKTHREGLKFLKEAISYLLRNRAYKWLPYVMGEAISRYAGYKLGLNYTMIPNHLRKRISMHVHYWKYIFR